MPDHILISLIVGIAQVASIVIGGLFVAYKLFASVALMGELTRQNSEAIKNIQLEVKAMQIAVTEISNQKTAIERLERWYEELRRGDGFMIPMARGSHSRTS